MFTQSASPIGLAVVELTRQSYLFNIKNLTELCLAPTAEFRINAICPGQIETDMLRAVEADAHPEDAAKARAAVMAAIPAGRYGEPEEVASLSAFLAGDDATFIYGSIYTIDGGFTPF